jgi:glycosyltransferase involved in cell wall biosynthesis
MKVAVVMGVYNGEAYLRETIDSILAQTYKDIEVIIVNDGSTDTTAKILEQITDERVNIIHLDVNQGAANALNIAIKQTEAGWIAIHDADDISLPDRIQEQVTYIQANPEVVAVGSFIECIKGNNISDSRTTGMARTKNSIITWEQIKEGLFQGCPLTHGSMLFSKEAYLKAGGYDTSYQIAYDYDLYTRLVSVGPIENVPKVLYQYRISSNSLSNLDVVKTSNEFLIACCKYIRSYWFSSKVNAPRVVVFGTKEGCRTFEDLMLNKAILNVREKISGFKEDKIKQVYKDFKKGNIDAFIILSNAPDENKIKSLLEQKGLTLNKKTFTLWCAI